MADIPTCQECGYIDYADNMQKVSGEGWLCVKCIEEWVKGEQQ